MRELAGMEHPSATSAPPARRPLHQRLFGTVPGPRWLVAGIIGISFVCAVLARLVAGDDFPTVGVAAWWAIQTVTTVGYGDTVPQSTEGKFIAGVLMVTAIASVSLITAAVSAGWVNRLQARRQAEHHDPVLAALERIERRLDALERGSADA